MVNDPAHGAPPPSKATDSSPSDRARKLGEGSEPSLPGGGTYFLGRYRIVDEIGVGGMASVHLARADGPGGFQKWVAIKRIHRHLAEDETFIRMFLDEARIAARISHPNVAQVFDLGKHRDTYWIAMEYLHGEPLREIIRAVEEGGAPPMGPHIAARLVADAAEGLHAAHELRDKNGKLLNLVHRDVTPHNLFLTYDGAVKVVDFGIAKVTGRLSTTRAGTLKGKLAYMSPEQVRGSAIDRRTDIFALGVVLWELTTSRRLFRMESDLETLERVQACVVPPPSSIIESYPVELEAIVMRALAKDPARRFGSTREMSRALQQYLMRCASFVGSEEIGAYVKHVLSDRFRKREAHLQWAAEVTQTISLDQLEGGPRELEDVSILTYASDVQEVPNKPRPAAGAPIPTPPAGPPAPPQAPVPRSPARRASTPPPPASRSRPVNATLPLGATAPWAAPPAAPPPRPAAGRPAGEGPLPRYDATGENEGLLEALDDDELAKTRVTGMGRLPDPVAIPKQTSLGLGPAPLPSFDSPPEMMDYGDDDEEAVTTVISAPSEAEDPPTISTVHDPAKKVVPAPLPDDKIVVSPSLMMPHEDPRAVPAQHYPGQYGVGTAPPLHQQRTFVQTRPSLPRDTRSLLIALIAAATTLIALALTALVILKLVEKPSEPPVAVTPIGPTRATVVPTPPPTPKVMAGPPPTIVQTPPTIVQTPPTIEKPETLKPEELPKETKPSTPAKSVATSTGAGTTSVPKSVATAAPAPGKAEPGYLTVVCDPFCDSVSAGGRSLGPSPVVRRPLPPGNHGVTLRKSGSPTKSISVTIVSGQTTARRVKMGS
jgi:eukaryotic-like serine/threonine-protein kinase